MENEEELYVYLKKGKFIGERIIISINVLEYKIFPNNSSVLTEAKYSHSQPVKTIKLEILNI